MTDASGTVVEAVDYYPYGSTRIDQTTNNFRENKQFVAQYSDPETNLSYLQARYYDGSNGEFLSEDPVFLGDPKQQVLTDPQSLNSYSYGNDNPTTKSDPTGKFAPAVAGPLLGGAALTPETLGVSLLIGAGAASVLYLASRNSFPSFPDGAPGYYQAVKLAQGSGYNTDPEFPSRPPKTPWGKVALTAFGTVVTIGGIEEFCGDWCLGAALRGKVPTGFNPNDPISSLPGISIGAYGTFSPTDRSACGTLCMVPQRSPMPATSAASARPSSGSSGSGSSGRSSSGSGTWGVVGPGSFNPYMPH